MASEYLEDLILVNEGRDSTFESVRNRRILLLRGDELISKTIGSHAREVLGVEWSYLEGKVTRADNDDAVAWFAAVDRTSFKSWHERMEAEIKAHVVSKASFCKSNEKYNQFLRGKNIQELRSIGRSDSPAHLLLRSDRSPYYRFLMDEIVSRFETRQSF